MKFISLLFFGMLLLTGCHRKTVGEVLEKDPSYKVMLSFSDQIHPETGLVLRCYGLNHVSKDYKFINGVANFKLSYSLSGKIGDKISLEQARNLLVFVVENFLKTVNSDPKVAPMLDVCPLTSDLVDIAIYFEDENRVHLENGIAIVYLWNREIRYEGYKIREYTGKYPAKGKHYVLFEESYADALEKVFDKGNRLFLSN